LYRLNKNSGCLEKDEVSQKPQQNRNRHQKAGKNRLRTQHQTTPKSF